ncbi:MAG: hypothetical protein FJ100_04270 [Deltaproteobacteria bacterium]|nr:hypothetical protein [Deltaproteobacteria bacterium]
MNRSVRTVRSAMVGLGLVAACAQSPESALSPKAPPLGGLPAVAVAPRLEAPAAIPQHTWQQLPAGHAAIESWSPARRDQVATRADPRGLLGDTLSTDAQLGAGVQVALMPDPEMPTRQRKRLNIDQLDAALVQASGGIGWTAAGKNQFQVLALTLGKPDYVDMTQEDLTASTLFQKFLGDAAASICTKLVVADAKAAADQRVFFVKAEPTASPTKDAAAIQANLAYLVKRWHGRSLAPNSAEIAQWQFLLASAQKVSTPAEGWQAVCVALATHPHFYTY